MSENNRGDKANLHQPSSKGSDYTDLSLGKVFGYKSSRTYGNSFPDGDPSGEAGYWLGYLDVDFDAPEEPYLSFDFAEIGTKQIPLTPCPES